jgi:drug/metabolite transporter (DMT)-like permease
MRTGRFVNIGTLVLVNLLWAAQYPAYKIASDHMSVAALNFWTLLLATVLLLVCLGFRRSKRSTPSPKLDRRSTVDFLLLGTLGLLPPSLMLSWGIAHSTAGNAAIIQLTIPVLMVLLAVLLLGERVTWLRVASLAIALVGTLLTSRRELGDARMGSSMLTGNIVIFFSGLGSAFFNTYSKRVLERFGELTVLIYTYVVASVCCGIISLLVDDRPFYAITGLPLAFWLSILTLGAFTWGIAMILWMWVLNRLEAIQVSTSIYMLSIFGVILSAVVLGERIGLPQIVGGALVFAGTFLTSEYDRGRKERNEQPKIA